MGYDFEREDGAEWSTTTVGWRLLLHLAARFGWSPAGTLPPEDWDSTEAWSGEYAGRGYQFVRVDRGEVEVVRFVRWEAGDAYCAAHCWEMESAAGDADGRRDILAYLQQQGFAELSEVRAAGVLPADRQPDADFGS